MVQVINQSVCGGIAGRRPNATPKGVVIHNDAGSIYATAAQYVNALAVMSPTQLANGFAHYYIDRNTIARVEDTFNAAWHTANSDGNLNYVGYEVCQSMGANDADFLANEQMTFKQIAEDMKFWGMQPNRDTVRLHKE
ncbi:N-acetylmuramoyl-L-alanine amidase, partial [Enterococcus faecalis]|nr:N-acetylmuramoyl-L-alanine amidase [Enterococcus faecalis]